MNDERLGTITPSYTIAFKRASRHSPARLWRAITTGSEVSAWMGYPAKVDLRVGGGWFVDFSRTGGGDLPGVIIRIEPEQVLTYAENLSVIEWRIEAAGEGCRYSFVQSGLPDRGDGEEVLCAGWHAFLDQFEGYLDGATPGSDDEDPNWERLKSFYKEQLRLALPGRTLI
jgi:uncharacterized protein YndB with AHSA1/START domain